ncbi:MAG: accessory factor UbiK family protein [Rhodospirillaceae bacterium]|nr:accessory factor UbiK family protein [Rhodospirillaceae bacterium]
MANPNRIFDDVAKMAGGALSAVAAFKQEVETMVRDRIDRLMSEANYVRREEFDAVKAMASAARAEQERLAARVAALEAASPAAATSPARTRAASKRKPMA